MITKDQFANYIIDNFCEEEKIKREDLNESHIYKSSSLAVAMEHLCLLKDKRSKDYASYRGGSFIELIENSGSEGCFSGIAILSTREMLSLLPETLEETK